jgi:hypothetical protein
LPGAYCKCWIIVVGLLTFILISAKPMKALKTITFFLTLTLLGSTLPSCGMIHNLFGSKYGCPSDGKNVGAERILSGEKLPKPPKFKA